jgi:hypothetical protein
MINIPFLSRKYKPWNRIFLYYDEEWRILLTEVTLSGDPRKDNNFIKKKLKPVKIIKQVYLKDIGKVIARFKVNQNFLLHFFEIMEQQEENISGKIIFDIPRIFERLQTQDIQYFEFYRYVLIELNKWKNLKEILSNIKWFEEYLEYFAMLDQLKEEDKAKLFGKLKEKILKEQEIKIKLLKPVLQPIFMFTIIILMFIWFSKWLLKWIIASFSYLGYPDEVPSIVQQVFNIWNFLYTNGLLIIFYILGFIILIKGILNIKYIKNFIQRQLFNFSFYKYFNEMLVAYVIYLQATNPKKWLRDLFYDLKESYKDKNEYYYFMYDLIYKSINIAAEKYIPLRKYGYIFSNEYINTLEQIIKQNKLSLINWFLRFVNWKINQIIDRIANIMWLVWLLIVAIWISILFLAVISWNNSRAQLMQKEAKWNVYEADVEIPLEDLLHNKQIFRNVN